MPPRVTNSGALQGGESEQTDAVPADAPPRPNEGGSKMRKGLVSVVVLTTALLLGPAGPGFAGRSGAGSSGGAWRGPTARLLAYRFPRECGGCTASRQAWAFPRAPRGRDAGLHRFRLLVGGTLVVGTCLPVLRCPAGARPGGAARVHPTGASSATALLLVLLPQPGGLLPLRQRVPAGLDDCRPAGKPASPVTGGWTCA